MAMLWLVAAPAHAGETDDRWWPIQVLPKSIVRTTNQLTFPEPRLAFQMMVQSVAGLAAKAVNEGKGDELVWVGNGDGDLERWYIRLLAQHPGIAKPGELRPWDLVDRFAKRGIIKGYILYRADTSPGDNNSDRPGMDCSVNVATSMAGLLNGIIVDEQLERKARSHGLKLLLDVRAKTQQWCFQNYQDQFNRRLLCFQDPRKPHARDLAIAQSVFTTYGNDEPTASAMAWLEPLSPILGENCGDEFEKTDLSTGYGDIQTATDWSLNLPVLMAESEKLDLPKIKRFDPAKIDWSDSRSTVAFVESDGDNVQWLEGNVFGNQSYWSNPKRGQIPFGWSCSFDQLAQLCPQAMGYALATCTANDAFIEWGGGYYYPDRFASQRTNRWELLGLQARRTWELMEKSNERIIGFNFSEIRSPEAHKACEVFAAQTDGLLAIFAYQYSPYEAGAGEVFWASDRNGNEVPVITARYSIWEHSNTREHAGTPAKVAREIRQTVDEITPGQPPRNDWVIAHAWSYFKKAPGSDDDAENMPQENAAAAGGMRGYTPVTWCAERLPASIRVVNPDELAWRVRMQHNPAQTKELMEQLQR